MKFSFQDYISIKIHKTDLLLSSFIKAKLEPFNLAPEQNLIMMLLWENDGLTQNELVKRLDKDKTNIARMASSLEKKGFIKRSECPNDRRSVKLYLTECGKELGTSVIPIAEQFNEIVRNGLTNEELLELDRLLSKITENVRSFS
ncbi:MarR family transcriptional regulator [Bacillus sp. 7586-K]|uniref:DNA-binding MarR family transcriptional regulator n=1 Tax=Metabacillus niabensis TaxID=324854 RepID=A0ABT9YV26_9BACI|nr:MarR family transcriptional regulator [Metabacillus niabensis]MDQ0223846.1 DNA-binding MarR family transcriptional regulator [Metabacillus niabensis]PAD69304.1 MarR family transcriptional regulator [Bacillus sp. 7586-K]